MAIHFRNGNQLSNEELNLLFGASWPKHSETDFSAVLSQSLSWISAYDGDMLVGFVNVAWDGGQHAFILDTTVHPDYRRQGLGTQLVKKAASISKENGVVWLHVDYEVHLESFYKQCGFRETKAGLWNLMEC